MSTDFNELIHDFLLGDAAITLDQSFIGPNSAALGQGMDTNFASKFKQFCETHSKVNMIIKPTFYFYFFLGSFYTAPCAGLTEKYQILDMNIKFDEKNRIIKLIFAHDVMGQANLEFRTVVLTRDEPHSLNDLSKYAFTAEELSELIRNFRIDDFSIQKLNFDWKIFKTFRRHPDSWTQFDAAWIKVENHKIMDTMSSILKSKILFSREDQFTRLERKVAEVHEIFNKPFLGLLQPVTAEHIKIHAHQIITHMQIVMMSDEHLSRVAKSGTNEEHAGFITGSIVMNMLKTYGLKINIGGQSPNGVHSFMMFPNSGSLSGQGTTLSTPIFVQLPADLNALRIMPRVLDKRYEERFPSIRYTRNKFASFVVTNFRIQDPNLATYSKVMRINHALLSKLVNNAEHFFKTSDHKFVENYIDNTFQQIFHQIKTRDFDVISSYLMGQLLTVRVTDSENNADFPKYIFKYQDSLSNDVKSLILHTESGVLAVNLIRESNDVYVNQFAKALERSYMITDDEPGVFSILEGLFHIDINFNAGGILVSVRSNKILQGHVTSFTVHGVLVPSIIPEFFTKELQSSRSAEITNRLARVLYELRIPQRYIGSFMTGFFDHSHTVLPFGTGQIVSLLNFDENSYINPLLLQQQASDHVWETNTAENLPDGRLTVKLWSAHSNVPLPYMRFYVKIDSDANNPLRYMEILGKHVFKYESIRDRGITCSTLTRGKRYLQDDCEPLMDDEEGVFEVDSKTHEISIDSGALLRYVKENRRSPGKVKQLFHIARKLASIEGAHFFKRVTGAQAKQLLEILATTEVPHKLKMLGKWSNRLTMGIMYKNIAVDLFHGNYGGAILGGALLGSGYVVPKLVNQIGVSLKTSSVASKIFRSSAPFLRRFASGFNIYSLVSSINQYTKTKDNIDMAGIVQSGTFLALDVAEIGTELAGLETLASVTGPVGMAIGAMVFIGAEAYIVHEKLKLYKEKLDMKLSEQVLEGLYTFITGDVEDSVKRELTEKLENIRLAEQMMKFLNDNPQFSSYIGQSASQRQDNIINLRSKVALTYARTLPDLGDKLLCFTDEQYEFEMHQKHATFFENFKQKLYSIWDYISKPFRSNEATFHGYICENALGVTTGKTGSTLITLSEGTDQVEISSRGDHVYLIGNGFKIINGNNQTDVFVLNGDRTSGYIHGYGGNDLIDLSNYATNDTLMLKITVDGYHTLIQMEGQILNIVNVTNLKARSAQPDHLIASCSLKSYDSGGGSGTSSDVIEILDQLCLYNITLKVHNNAKVSNAARLGTFIYQIELSHGSMYFSNPLDSYASHDFVFMDTPFTDIDDVLYSDNNLSFSFWPKNNTVNIFNVSGMHIFHFSDHFTVITDKSRTLHAFQNSNSDPYSVIDSLYSLAQRTSVYINVKTDDNATIIIGHRSKHLNLKSGHHAPHVIENDPGHESFLVGCPTSNIFVIKRSLNLTKTKIFIMNDDYHNTIDLSRFWLNAQPIIDLFYSDQDLHILLSSDNATSLDMNVKNCTQNKLEKLSILTDIPMRIQSRSKQLNLIPVPFHINSKEQQEFIIEADHIKPGLVVNVDSNADECRFFKHDHNLIALFSYSTSDYPIFTLIIKDFYTVRRYGLDVKFLNKTFQIDEIGSSTASSLVDLDSDDFIDIIVQQIEKYKTFS